MPWGVRLDGTDADRAALLAVLGRSARAFVAEWQVLDVGDHVSFVVTDALTRDDALHLAAHGHDVAQLAPGASGSIEVLRVRTGATLPVATLRTRRASGLLQALSPRPAPAAGAGRSAPAEGVFVVDDATESARLLERLLLLDRQDARVCDVDVDDDDGAGQRKLLVRVTAPPVWLLLWCQDEPARGVTAYVRHDDEGTALFTEFGHRHPLADRLGAALQQRSEIGLLDGNGRLRRTRAPWPEQSLHDALSPVLPASPQLLEPQPVTRRFTVVLRLAASGADDGFEPELFLLDDDDDLLRLETFVEGASADELGRLLLSRVGGVDGRSRTVLREAVRVGAPRLGARLSSLLQQPGFVRVVGFDGLYLPPGRRLVPQLRRDDLRKLLDLEDAAAVIVDEDTDGLRLVRIPRLDDEPMSRLVTFLATSRRQELDRLLEDAVLSFPGLSLERPRLPTPPPKPQAPVTAKAVVVAPRKPPPPTTAPAAAAVTAKDESVESLRARERELEELVTADAGADADAHAGANAGADDRDVVDAWTELAAVKLALKDKDDAAITAGTALFLAPPVVSSTRSGPEPPLPGRLGPEPPLPGRLGPGTAVATLIRASDNAADIVALCTTERPTHAQAQRLCGLVLQALARSGETPTGAGDVDDGVLQQAEKVLSATDVPLPRRLQWAVLRAIHGRASDPIGLTRAKEAVVGALNVRGLTEALDLPRFVRTRLALNDATPGDPGTPLQGRSGPGAGRSGPGQRVQARGEQLVVVERLLPRVVPRPLDISERREALLKAIFLNGLARLGGEVKDLGRAIEHELPAHDGPVRVLLRLYVSRAAFVLTSDGSDAAYEAWREEVRRAVAAADRVEDRRVAEWLIKRSLWLRPDPVTEPPLTLRPALEKIVGATARGERSDVVDSIRAVMSHTGSYDFEVAAALERLLEVALESGRDDVIEAAADAAWRAAPTLRILAHRARLLGAVVKAAASVGAASVVERALDDVAAIANDKNVPSTRDLLLAVRPALFALRRLGALEAARRFLRAFEPLTLQTGRETGPLAAALAEGFHQLGEHDAAEALLERALSRVTAPETVHVDRYEAGAAVISALAHWPHGARAARCEALFLGLSRFSDTFTTQSWFPTHQLLIAERLVECLVDEVTVRSDRLQAFLDQDEARVRRRILADWRAALA